MTYEQSKTRLKILIVEDSEPFIELAKRFIEPLLLAFPNSTVITTGCLDAAITEINKVDPPHITLLDLTLEKHSLDETISQLEAMEERTAVVIISGSPKDLILKKIGDRQTPVLSKLEVVNNFWLLPQAIYAALKFWQSRKNKQIEEDLRIIAAVGHHQYVDTE